MLACMKPLRMLLMLFLLLPVLAGCAAAQPEEELQMPPEFLGWWHPVADYVGIDIRPDGTMEGRVESRDYKGDPLVTKERYKIFHIQDGEVYAIREIRFTDGKPDKNPMYRYVRLDFRSQDKYLPNSLYLGIASASCGLLSQDEFDNVPAWVHWRRLTDKNFICGYASSDTDFWGTRETYVRYKDED